MTQLKADDFEPEPEEFAGYSAKVSAKPTDPPVVETTIAERIVRIMPELDRKKLEKEIQGLTAKLKWSHIPESLKDVYRIRIKDLEGELKEAG